ncbi:MAG: tetratricopeptide repeat protein [Verrucomicrobiae bacterium]|nr:tetratricopeptide repeat protein [Verrucomicrobiae bacterium]
MSTAQVCPVCHASLPSDAPGGFCPRCLLKVFAAFPADLARETREAVVAVGTEIGAYRLLELLAEGGMGAVFLAEQTEPIQRRVALKLIKPGMDSRRVIARFEAERQALALMDHPHIARVLDAGTTQQGRPYFVMELVQGAPITEFCDRRRLSLRERLALMIPVCQAVQHAHQKGILHRDLKPSNVLVTELDGRPAAKVIDFGLAKAIGDPLTEHTVFTQAGQIVGTIDYMSPEQARLDHSNVDTRSDLYSLGVLLYELLTGERPFARERLRSAAFDEVLRIIRQEEPAKPSARLASSATLPANAARRGLEPRSLTTALRGELDWIVMKCLEKERDRRYESAGALARDLERYLRDQPVRAGPPSTSYRLKKFARRHRVSLVAASLALIALLAMVVGIGWSVRDRIVRQLAFDQRISQALADGAEAIHNHKLLEASAALRRAEDLIPPGEGRSKLDRQVLALRRDLEMAERLEEIRFERSEVKDDHFDYLAGDRAYQAAFRRYGLDLESLTPDEVGRRVRASAIHAQLVFGLDDWLEVKETGRLPGREHLIAVARQCDPAPWRERLLDAYQRADKETLRFLARQPELAEQAPHTILLISSLLQLADERPLAVDILTHACRHHPGDYWLHQQLGACLLPVSPERAVECFRAALALCPRRPVFRINLGIALLKCNRLEEAEEELREAIRMQPDFALSHRVLGGVLLARGDARNAELKFREAIRLKPDDPHHLYHLGGFLLQQGRWADAKEVFRQAVHLAPDHPAERADLATVLLYEGEVAEAEAEYREAIRLGITGSKTHLSLATLLSEQGRWDEAEAIFREALRRDPVADSAHQGLGFVLQEQGRVQEAIAAYREAVRVVPTRAITRYNLAGQLFVLGEYAAAEPELRAAIEAQPDFLEPYLALTETLLRLGRQPEAEAVIREALRVNPGDQRAASMQAALRAASRSTELVKRAQEKAQIEPQSAAAHMALADACARLGRWQDARAAIVCVLELDPGDHFNWYRAVILHLQVGDETSYRKTWREMLARFGDSDQPEVLERIAKAGLLVPTLGADLNDALALANRTIAGTERHSYYVYFLLAKTLAEFRGGNHAQATEWFTRCAPPRGVFPYDAFAYSLGGLIFHHLGRPQEAAKFLNLGRAILSHAADPPAGPPFLDNDWHDWLMARMLFREALGIVNTDETASRPAPSSAESSLPPTNP